MRSRVRWLLALPACAGACASFSSEGTTATTATTDAGADAGADDASPADGGAVDTCHHERLTFDTGVVYPLWDLSGPPTWASDEGMTAKGALRAELGAQATESQIGKNFDGRPSEVDAKFAVKLQQVQSGDYERIGCTIELTDLDAGASFTELFFGVTETIVRFHHGVPAEAGVSSVPSVQIASATADPTWRRFEIRMTKIREGAMTPRIFYEGSEIVLPTTDYPIAGDPKTLRVKCGIDEGTALNVPIWVDDIDLAVCP